ncbi:unnamed protein product [Effrenium voratum]|nr:unnamed protein product [Effrenium voratum]
MGHFAVPRVYIAVRRWQRKQARLDAINQEYENLRSVRKDAVYHHGWAQSRGEFREAKDHEAHVVDIDRKLGILREQYKAVEDGRLDDFSGVIIAEGSKEK